MSNLPTPFWSVMVPTFERVTYLQATLDAIMAARRSARPMQICVVDNRSPSGAPKQIVDRMSGTIEWHQNSSNLGMFSNWNQCLQLARGSWIHILHDDDLVAPSFYREMEDLVAAHPQARIAFCPSHLIDDAGRNLGRTEPFCTKPGYLENFSTTLAQHDPIQSPGAIISREVAQNMRGFREDLKFAADWDYWFRASLQFPIAATPHLLTFYRVHLDRATAALENSRDTVAEFLHLEQTFRAEIRARGGPPVPTHGAVSQARSLARHLAFQSADRGDFTQVVQWQILSFTMYARWRDLARLLPLMARAIWKKLF